MSVGASCVLVSAGASVLGAVFAGGVFVLGAALGVIVGIVIPNPFSCSVTSFGNDCTAPDCDSKSAVFLVGIPAVFWRSAALTSVRVTCLPVAGVTVSKGMFFSAAYAVAVSVALTLFTPCFLAEDLVCIPPRGCCC